MLTAKVGEFNNAIKEVFNHYGFMNVKLDIQLSV